MSTSWTLLNATDAEARAFPTLAQVLELPSERAAPPNAHREVHRIDALGAEFYLKIFRRTQLKNRLRNRTTRPHCDLDAGREAAVAAALLERDIRVARPIAIGRAGDASYYLCAAVPGRSAAELHATGEWNPLDDARIARFCGEIAKRGVVLTDLSADHVYRIDDRKIENGRNDEFAVIDLHNGRLRSRPTRRELVRMLRRFARSVRGLGIDRTRALRFAVRLLHATGRGSATRSVLNRLAPFDTHGRYDIAGRSGRYAERNPRRTEAELALLRACWPGRAGDVVVDVPSGAGRLGPLIRDSGARWLPADRSASMLAELRARHPNAHAGLCDAAQLPFAAQSAQGVVVFRLLHHLDPTAARAVVDEAARVARDWIVVSFFHPISFHNAQRKIRAVLSGSARTRFTIWPRELQAWLATHGFGSPRFVAQSAYRRDLWIGTFRRTSAPKPATRPPAEDARTQPEFSP